MAKSALDKEIQKLWKILNNSPEKGFKTGSLDSFTSTIKDKMGSDKWAPDDGWAYKLSEIKKSYGVGPTTMIQKRATIAGNRGPTGPAVSWWQREEAHLSKDGKYYVVPLVFEEFTKNVHLVQYKGADGKYNIGEYGKPGTLLGTKAFTDNCKKWALEKLKRNLDKAIASEQIESWSKDYGVIPKNKMVGNKSIVQAWVLSPRNPSYQTLWIKVLFDKSWVDSLPAKIDPDIDYGAVTREVMIFTKDIGQYLTNLETILKHFDAQMQLSYAQSGVETSFNASCLLSNISKIYEVLDGLLVANKKDALKDLEKTNGALQFGFTEQLELKYIAHSDVPDCLCDPNENMNAFNLRVSLDLVKSKSPLSNPTINNFIYLLPAINRRYSRYLRTTNKISGDLFSTEQSWLSFINTYVYPKPDVAYSGTKSSDFEKAWLATLGTMKEFGNPFYKNLLFSGKYIQDPVGSILSPDLKNMVVGASQVAYLDGRDDNMIKALMADVESITSVYDHLLNRVPISEMVKIFASIAFKCLANDELRKKMCETTLKTIPIVEIRQQLYPCLRDLGPEGELAIAKLEEKLTGRTGLVYKVAQDRYPDKFPQTDNPAEQAKALSQVTSLYCSDPYMQKKLGRSPDDFNDELAAWADEAASDAICDCILTLYGPASQLIDAAQEVAEGVVDGILSPSKDKAHNMDKEATLALDRIVDPIKNFLKSQNKMADVGKSFANAMNQLAWSIILAGVRILLKYIKDEILGNLTKDMCNSNGDVYSPTSMKDFLKKSTLYEDTGDGEIFNKFKDLKAKHYFSQEIQDMITSYEKIDKILSPSEIKRAFTTECNDNSFDSKYETVAFAFMSDSAKKQLTKDFPGESLSSIIAITGYVPTAPNSAKKEDPKTGKLVPYDFPADFTTPGQIHDFLFDLGNTIDPSLLDDNIEQFEEIKNQFSSICDPINLDQLEKTINKEDVIAAATSDAEDILDDIASIMPFLDRDKMENMFPPLFCGPCAPNQAGMEPMMASQTHPTQLFMQERLNDHTYKIIDDVFNNNLSVYKNIINEVNGAEAISDLLGSLPTEIDQDNPDPQAAYGEAVKEMLKGAGEKNSDVEKNKFTAATFRNKILQMTAGNFGQLGQLKNFDPESKIAEFSYEIPDTPYVMTIVFNFSEESYTFNGIDIEPPQIKLIVMNGAILEYVYPQDDEGVKDFNLEDAADEFLEYFLKPSGNEGKVISALLAIDEIFGSKKSSELFKSLFPISANLILETVWNNMQQNDLFLTDKFNSMPLTNTEALDKCKETDSTPLLNVEKNKQDVEEFRKSLECVVSMFATPDSLQIANLCGLYKILMKVCIVEEYLKNIFIFTFAKISDVIEDPAYMALVKESVKDSVESILSTGYEDLLSYSEKVVNGRAKIMDPDDLEGLSEDDEKLKDLKMRTPEECLDILISEAAVEVDSILDTRVRLHVDKSWKDKFISIKDIKQDDPESYLKNGFFESAINTDLMEDTRYPARKYIQGGASDGSAHAVLQTDQLPSFEVIDENTKATTQSTKIDPFPSNSEGGLFYEPFVRMNSKLDVEYSGDNSLQSLEVGDIDPEASVKGQFYLNNFWNKFKEALNLWEKAVFRPGNDVNIEAIGGNPYGGKTFNTMMNFPTVTLAKDIVKNSYEWPMNSKPFGSVFPSNLDSKLSLVHTRVKFIVEKINSELEENGVLAFSNSGMDSTFLQFFKLFFSPLSENGQPYSKLPNDQMADFGMAQANGFGQENHRAVFEGIVSSFVHFEQKGGQVEQKFGGSGDPLYASIAGKKYGQDPKYLDAFYYWQSYPNGVIPAARHHFKSRGVIGLTSFGSYSPHKYGNLPVPFAKTSFFIYGKNSIIDVFAAAKEVNFGVDNSSTQTQNVATQHNSSYIKTIKLFMMDNLGTADIPDEEVIDFYNWIKLAIIEAPFDLWFDISLGMRLNLIVPYQSSAGEDSQINQEYIKNLIDTFVDLSQYPMIKNDEDYNLDKVFLLSSPGAGVNINDPSKNKWLCIPLEVVEYDLLQYWQEIYQALHANDTIPEEPTSQALLQKELLAFTNDSSDFAGKLPKNNPWNLIMRDIPRLGAGRVTSGGDGVNENIYRYNYASGGETFYENLYNNMHVPKTIYTPHMSLGANPPAYYRLDGMPRPNLWAACKMINTTLSQEMRKWPEGEMVVNETKVQIVDELKKQLLNKVVVNDSKILNEIMPVRESIFTTAVLYRYAMQSAYPSLDNLFSPTKLLINSFITQSIKTFEGDYAYVNEVVKQADQEARINTSSPAPDDIASLFMKLVVQMAANTVDPTWKTPWFFPGPLTPVGIIAKLISSKTEDNNKGSAEDLKKQSLTDKECEDEQT